MSRPILLTLACLLLPVSVGAQAPAPETASGPDSVQLRRLRVRFERPQRARVVMGSTAIEITSAGVDRAGVWGAGGSAAAVRVPWEDVAQLQVRVSGLGRGVVIGGSIGAGLGLLIGLGSLRDCQGWGDLFCGASGGEVVGFTVMSGLIYGLVGGGIGALTHRWQTVYRAGPRRPAVLPVALIPAGRSRIAIAGSVRW